MKDDYLRYGENKLLSTRIMIMMTIMKNLIKKVNKPFVNLRPKLAFCIIDGELSSFL